MQRDAALTNDLLMQIWSLYTRAPKRLQHLFILPIKDCLFTLEQFMHAEGTQFRSIVDQNLLSRLQTAVTIPAEDKAEDGELTTLSLSSPSLTWHHSEAAAAFSGPPSGGKIRQRYFRNDNDSRPGPPGYPQGHPGTYSSSHSSGNSTGGYFAGGYSSDLPAGYPAGGSAGYPSQASAAEAHDRRMLLRNAGAVFSLTEIVERLSRDVDTATHLAVQMPEVSRLIAEATWFETTSLRQIDPARVTALARILNLVGHQMDAQSRADPDGNRPDSRRSARGLMSGRGESRRLAGRSVAGKMNDRGIEILQPRTQAQNANRPSRQEPSRKRRKLNERGGPMRIEASQNVALKVTGGPHSGNTDTIWQSPGVRRHLSIEDVQKLLLLRRSLQDLVTINPTIDPYRLEEPLSRLSTSTAIPAGPLLMALACGRTYDSAHRTCTLCGLISRTAGDFRLHMQSHVIRAAPFLPSILGQANLEEPVSCLPLRPFMSVDAAALGLSLDPDQPENIDLLRAPKALDESSPCRLNLIVSLAPSETFDVSVNAYPPNAETRCPLCEGSFELTRKGSNWFLHSKSNSTNFSQFILFRCHRYSLG